MNLLYVQLSFLNTTKKNELFLTSGLSKERSHGLKNTIHYSDFHGERHKFRGTEIRYFMAVISMGTDTLLFC